MPDNFVVDFETGSRSFTTWDAALRCAKGKAQSGQWATVGTASGALLRVCKPRRRR